LRWLLIEVIGHCRTDTLLSSEPWHHVSDPPHAVDADIGVYICRVDQVVVGQAEQYDLAWDIDVYRHVYDAARRRK
jgi:hypothetical protein